MSNRCWGPAAFKEKIRASSLIPLATSLAIWYALNDTLLGYGKLNRDEKFTTLRVLLLNAMDVFVIGNEIALLSFHPSHLETFGVPPGQSVKELEMGCESIGLAVCTVYGIEEKNFCKNFFGATRCFYGVHLCDIVKEIIMGKSSMQSDTHPAIVECIENIFSFVKKAELHQDTLK